MNIFDYESKFNQALMTMADLIILNILYLVCCIPVFTISAAQAGLFTGIRVLLDKEDDSSVAKAFFRGFKDEFKTSTLAGLIVLGMLAVACFVFVYTFAYYSAGNSVIPLVLNIVIMVVLYAMHSLIGPFHASFGCRIGQLVRNAFFVVFAYPFRSLLVAALTLLPLAVMMVRPDIFLGSIVAVLALYYSAAYLACFALLKKPFNRLKESYARAHEEADEDDSEDDAPAELPEGTTESTDED